MIFRRKRKNFILIWFYITPFTFFWFQFHLLFHPPLQCVLHFALGFLHLHYRPVIQIQKGKALDSFTVLFLKLLSLMNVNSLWDINSLQGEIFCGSFKKRATSGLQSVSCSCIFINLSKPERWGWNRRLQRTDREVRSGNEASLPSRVFGNPPAIRLLVVDKQDFTFLCH